MCHAQIQKGWVGKGFKTPMQNHKAIGFLNNTINVPISETPLNDDFLAGQIMARKSLSELDPLWQNCLDPRMCAMPNHPSRSVDQSFIVNLLSDFNILSDYSITVTDSIQTIP